MIPAKSYIGTKGTHFLLVDNDELADALYRFRYLVYIEKMNRNQDYANHDKKTIEEPLDQFGYNYVAIKNGFIVGCIRRNYLSDGDIDYYHEFYEIDKFKCTSSNSIGITTKLMFIDEYKGTRLPLMLIKHYAKESCLKGMEIDVIDCNDYLVEFFERLGYFTHTGWKHHKEYGRVMPMFLSLDAKSYLDKIKSPLFSCFDSIKVDNQYGGRNKIKELAILPSSDSISKIANEIYRMGK